MGGSPGGGWPPLAPGGTGESLRTVEERVLAARDRCLADHPGRTVVLVSHDAVLRPILEAIAGTAIPEPIAPGSCHIIAVDGGRWSIEAFDWGSPSGH